ncbi:hypothetical protein NL676_038163 [Syzygium grande]|nr:hypothetical protein NL676_038163 [Syzygium grande]
MMMVVVDDDADRGLKKKAGNNHNAGSVRDGSDLVTALATLGEVRRRKRMARLRRPRVSFLTFPRDSASHVPHCPLHLQPHAREIDPRRLRFLFQKELKNSDVSSLRRMILPKVIQAKKGSEEDVYTDIAKSIISDLPLRDRDEMNSNINSFDESYPAIIHDVEMSFVYDNSFSNASPLDFLGGSMTNYARISPPESFGTVDNWCFDDFC